MLERFAMAVGWIGFVWAWTLAVVALLFGSALFLGFIDFVQWLAQ